MLILGSLSLAGLTLVVLKMLIVAPFRRYFVPLVIMAPIPLTIIGVMPGHALLGAAATPPRATGRAPR